MAELREFKLPDVGEGLVEAEIVSWRVKPGDAVKVNDIVVEIETVKSLVELPCPYDGTVAELLVPEGQVVPVGTPIIRIGVGKAAGVAPTPAGAGAPAAASATDNGAAGGPAGDGATSTLVGYGPKPTAAGRRPRSRPGSPPPAVPASAAAPAPTTAPPAAPAPSVVPTPTPTPAPAPEPTPVRAKPPVRKLAKDLGVDLHTVLPTGPDGTVSRADVEAFAAATAVAPAEVGPGVPERAAPGMRETRVPVRGVRRATAQAVTQSAFTAPHVTEWVSVDATATMDLLAKLKERRDLADVKLTPLVVVAKACLLALRRTPELNATWDDAAGEIILKHYVNLGIAAATPRGLVVPNIKDADQLSLPDLARALNHLAKTAREGRTPPADMQHTSFTITNVGVFGIDGGTPILNPGESGILAVGAIRKQPWVVDDEVVPRWVVTLSVSFDHRIVDGEQGSRFLADVASVLEDPANALLLA
ncbi:dihydrolipoamide acetyltransferase family protein [Actinopolymorpha alba]|uniref:dihydrolipoamide acetyltransferase family protein n=1 Tax=Actinopolymorpha alba TaxID=533267 RepID=UPI000382C188|nr:dihydrolipoamide acetyltransferase family protein [Actinopolymorpha alba]